MKAPLKKFCILGGSGFLGRALTKYLKKNVRARVLSLSSSDLDLTRPESVKRLARFVDSQTCLIVAARPAKTQNPSKDYRADLAISRNLASFLRRSEVAQVIYLSSSAVYGDARNRIDVTEKSRPHPTSAYGRARLKGENLVKQAARFRKMHLVILRLCMVYGPGDSGEAYGPVRFLREAHNDGKIRINGDGSEERDYLYIGDLCRLIHGLTDRRIRGTFVVGSGCGVSFRRLAKEIRRLSGNRCRIEHLVKNSRPVTVRLDIKKLKSVFPNFRFVTMRQGLKMTWRSIH